MTGEPDIAFRPPLRLFAVLATLGAAYAAMASGCTRLGAFNTLVPHDRGGERVERDVAYGPADRQRLDIYRPAGRHGDLPVVFFIYGGSWNSGRKADYSFVGRAFAAAGFVTVIADYRLVPNVRYPGFLQDNAKALAWTWRSIAAYGGDPQSLFAAGHSAGAYNAVMLALAPDLLAAEGLQPDAIKGVAGLSGPYDFYPFDTPASRAAFKGAADPPATQPVNLVTPRAPPAFLAAGRDDEVVRPRNTERLATRLAAHGVAVETKVYPGLGHAGTLLAISRPLRGRAPVLEDVTSFFRRIRKLHPQLPRGK